MGQQTQVKNHSEDPIPAIFFEKMPFDSKNVPFIVFKIYNDNRPSMPYAPTYHQVDSSLLRPLRSFRADSEMRFFLPFGDS